MSGEQKTKSAIVKAGMDRVCKEFTEQIAHLGFRRTNSRSRCWEYHSDGTAWIIHFHRCGSSYGGAPDNHGIDIRVEYYIKVPKNCLDRTEFLNSQQVRDSRGYAYHLRFNALSWSMYERCLKDLLRVTYEHGLPWFEQQNARIHKFD